MKKKFYVGLPLVIFWTIAGVVLSLVLYIWWTSDVGKFVPIAFIMLLLLPITIELVLILIFCQYVTIDEGGIKRYNVFGKVVAEYIWKDIQEVRVNAVWLYVSLEKLVGETKNWDQKSIYPLCIAKKRCVVYNSIYP